MHWHPPDMLFPSDTETDIWNKRWIITQIFLLIRQNISVAFHSPTLQSVPKQNILTFSENFSFFFSFSLWLGSSTSNCYHISPCKLFALSVPAEISTPRRLNAFLSLFFFENKSPKLSIFISALLELIKNWRFQSCQGLRTLALILMKTYSKSWTETILLNHMNVFYSFLIHEDTIWLCKWLFSLQFLYILLLNCWHIQNMQYIVRFQSCEGWHDNHFSQQENLQLCLRSYSLFFMAPNTFLQRFLCEKTFIVALYYMHNYCTSCSFYKHNAIVII